MASDHLRSGDRSSAEVNFGRKIAVVDDVLNFWKQFYGKFPQYREASKLITPAIKSSGTRSRPANSYGFVSGLGFSQLLFAWAAEDSKRLLKSLSVTCTTPI